MIDRNTLAARVLDAFPTGRYGLLALLRIIDIEASEKKRCKPLQPVYRALSSGTGADYSELFQSLCSVMPEAQVMPRLLGRHDGELEKLDESGALFDAVRAIVETWPQPPNPIAGRSWSELLGSERVQL